MAFKIFFLVILGASLAVANLPPNLQREYEEITQNSANKLIVQYFHETNPLKIELNWDLFLGNALLILEKGKLVAIQGAGNNIELAEAIKKQWDIVRDAGVKGQFEVRDIIDSLRIRALRYAPAEWNQVADMSKKLLAAFTQTARSGNPYKTRETLTLCTNSFREAKVRMERLIASRQYN